jgi:hypothetical protein
MRLLYGKDLENSKRVFKPVEREETKKTMRWIGSVVVLFAMVMWGSLPGLGQNKQLYVGPPTQCSSTVTGPREAQWNIDGWWNGPGCTSIHSINASCGQTPGTTCGSDPGGIPTGVSVFETNCGTCTEITHNAQPYYAESVMWHVHRQLCPMEHGQLSRMWLSSVSIRSELQPTAQA